MDVRSPFISVLCHSDWLFRGESCPRLDVVHPGRVWPSSPACTWHCSLHYLFLKATFSGVRWKKWPHESPQNHPWLWYSTHRLGACSSKGKVLHGSAVVVGATVTHTHAYINEYTYYVGKIPSFWKMTVRERGQIKSDHFVMHLNKSA